MDKCVSVCVCGWVCAFVWVWYACMYVHAVHMCEVLARFFN